MIAPRNYIHFWYYVLSIFFLCLSGTLTHVYGQKNDIHSAELVKQKQLIYREVDSLSHFDYSAAYLTCKEYLSNTSFTDEPDLYSDLIYKSCVSAYQMGYVDISDSLENLLLNLRLKNTHPILQARIFFNKSRLSLFLRRFIDAINYGKEGLAIYQMNENLRGQILLNQTIGNIYQRMGRFDASLEYYKNAASIAKKAKREKEYCKALLATAKSLIESGNPNEALEYLATVSGIEKRINDKEISARLDFVYGQCYYSLGNYFKADDYFDASLFNSLKINMMIFSSHVYTWKSSVASKHGDLIKTIALDTKAAQIRGDACSIYLKASSMYNIAKSYIALKKYDSAMLFINRGEELYSSFKFQPDYIRGMDLKRSIFLEKKEYEKAFKILESKMIIEDSLFSNGNALKLKEIESDYTNGMFEQTKQEMLLESQVQKMETKRNELILKVVIAIFLLVLVFSILILLHIKNKNKRDVILVSQKLIFIQMNSHFVFNALTAIQSLIYKKHLESAIHNLTIFTSLINKIMDVTQKKYINLQTEIEFIIEFLKIQKLRFGDLLKYQINIDDDVDMANTLVPPLLAYPFIEYAVEERVQKASNKGMLIINISKSEKFINYEIVDMGLGFVDMKNCFIKRFSGQEILCDQLSKERISVYNTFLRTRIIFAEIKKTIEGKEYPTLQFKIKI